VDHPRHGARLLWSEIHRPDHRLLATFRPTPTPDAPGTAKYIAGTEYLFVTEV
jgi:hypothetical protein